MCPAQVYEIDDDGVVTILNLEASPGVCDVSGGETMLDAVTKAA